MEYWSPTNFYPQRVDAVLPDNWAFFGVAKVQPHKISPAKNTVNTGFSTLCPQSYPQGSLSMSDLIHKVIPGYN